MTIIKLLQAGCDRVLDSQAGMIFIVDFFTPSSEGDVAHIRDYRYSNDLVSNKFEKRFQIWSIPNRGYEIVKE